jgi:hypothetical protein
MGHFKKIVQQGYATQDGTETKTDSDAAEATLLDHIDISGGATVLDKIDPIGHK